MNLASEYQRVQTRKFDFSLAYETIGGSEQGEKQVRIYLKQNGNAGPDYLDYSDIILVQYTLDESFNTKPIASKDPGNRFEIRMWVNGNFYVTATILLKAGRTEIISANIDVSKPNEEHRFAR